MEFFTDWHRPRKSHAGNREQVRISKNFISISRICVEKYFANQKFAKIGFDHIHNRVLIKPTSEEDEYGLKLHDREKSKSNFPYINAKQFIEEYGLAPPENKKSIQYDCKWDDANKWIVVDDIKNYGGMR